MDKATTQLLIRAAIPVLLAALWFGLIYHPNRKAVQNLEQRKQELIINMGREIPQSEITSLQQRLDGLKADYRDRQKHFFPPGRLSGVGDFVRSLGREAGLTLFNITPDYTTISGFLESGRDVIPFPVELEYRGSFAAFTRLWDRLEDPEYFFKIEEYSLGFAEAGKPALRIRLNGRMFIRRSAPGLNRIEQVSLAQGSEKSSTPSRRQ
ncbi:MAG TPA: hypothetical protein ENN17_01090 [bacterium]|nr:hypothetical protein [bacterium]